jgi:glycine/D-amino acid oxidase-like deaminating enzyme
MKETRSGFVSVVGFSRHSFMQGPATDQHVADSLSTARPPPSTLTHSPPTASRAAARSRRARDRLIVAETGTLRSTDP